MSNDIMLLTDLAWTSSKNKMVQTCDKLYKKYSDELNTLYKENCTTYINFMTHISFTLKVLSKNVETKTDMWTVKQIAVHSISILNVINDYGTLDFAKLPVWQILNICHSVKKLIGYSGMQLDKSTCLGEILNDKDFEIVKHYVETGKIMEE